MKKFFLVFIIFLLGLSAVYSYDKFQIEDENEDVRGEVADNVSQIHLKRFDKLPFQRILDVELVPFLGHPDVVGLCLEGHPTSKLSIEICRGTMIIIDSFSVNMKYRWDLILREETRFFFRGKKNRIRQLRLGPGLGVRYIRSSTAVEEGLWSEAWVSLENVFWYRKHFGFTTQLDLGVGLTISQGNYDSYLSGMILGKLTFGLAF